MTVKRFVAKDMRRALDLVREDMGSNAIILSSQRTPEGVEIITSLEADLPTRGADSRKEFGSRFDQELDSPLESDCAWQVQQGMEQAADRYKTHPVAVKLPENPECSEALTAKIEAARLKMLADKRAKRRALEAGAEHPKENGYLDKTFKSSPEPRACEAQSTQSRGTITEPENAGVANSQLGDVAAPADRLDRQMAGLHAQISQSAADRQVMDPEQPNGDNSDRRLNQLQDQIADMRLLLEQQMWRSRDSQVLGSSSAATCLLNETISRHLEHLGLPKELIAQLAANASEGKHLSTAWRESLEMLASKIVTDTSDTVQNGGVFAFVGPTGVGKTTTIAKLASRYVLEHGIGKVALITTDTYRVGAHDQLRALGRILNVPVRVVDRERSLATVVASLKGYPLVLIDTAGFRQGDPLLKQQEALLDSCIHLKRVLVLATNSQKQNLKASAHAYGQKNLSGCVLTKLDETASLGEALGVAVEQRLPIIYTSDGQGIPKDIAVASADALVAKAVAVTKNQYQGATPIAGIS